MPTAKQYFGAALIAGAGAIASQIEPVESYVDDAFNDTKTFLQTEFHLSENQAIGVGLGGAGLVILAGIGAIAGSARRKLEAEQGLNPDVVAKLEEIGQGTTAELKAMRQQMAEMDNAVVLLERRVLEPLGIDTAALEDALAKLKDTEMAAGDTLDVIRNIEAEVDKVVASITPRDFAHEMQDVREEYSEAYEELVKTTKEAFDELEGYSKQHGAILSKLIELDTTIKQSIVSGKEMDSSIPTSFLNAVAEQLGSIEDDIGGSCYYFPEIISDATLLAQKATQYALITQEMKQAANTQQSLNGVDQAKPDTPRGPTLTGLEIG